MAGAGGRRRAPPAPGGGWRSGSVQLGVELDDAVVPALAAVDHLGVAGFGIEEQEEVMADELYVVERVVNAHGLGGVLLLADDHGAAGLGQIRLRRLRGLRGFGGL